MADIYEGIYELLRDKRYEEALSKLISSDHKRINTPYDEDLNHAWYLVGDLFFKTSKFDLAISAFTKALDSRPDDCDAILALSNSYSELGLAKKAEETLCRGLALKPSDEKLIYNLANSLFDQDKFEDAINFYGEIKDDAELVRMAAENIKLSKRKLRNKSSAKDPN